MAWSWSHTNEGIDYAREALNAQSREFLETVFAEIKATGRKWSPNSGDSAPFFESVYKREIGRARRLPSDILADAIWEFAEEYQTCDNGGYDAHMCPYGCSCHTVPFGPPDD